MRLKQTVSPVDRNGIIYMIYVKIKWLTSNEGGRKSPPPVGKYFSVARFPSDQEWQSNAWSVVFDLLPPIDVDGCKLSEGNVSFMMDNAPKERFEKYDRFDIYEGPHKVGLVSIVSK